MYGTQGDTLLAGLAVLSLVASLVVANMNYGARSRSMEANYKRIQQISAELENLTIDRDQLTRDQLTRLQREYSIAVDTSENHSSGDHGRASKQSDPARWHELRWQIRRDMTVTLLPYLSVIVPILIIIPFAKSIVNAW